MRIQIRIQIITLMRMRIRILLYLTAPLPTPALFDVFVCNTEQWEDLDGLIYNHLNAVDPYGTYQDLDPNLT